MAVVTKIEPQYAPQGHILSLKVELRNEKSIQTQIKVGISVINQSEVSDITDSKSDSESIKFTDLYIPRQETVVVDLLLSNPILPKNKNTVFTVILSE